MIILLPHEILKIIIFLKFINYIYNCYLFSLKLILLYCFTHYIIITTIKLFSLLYKIILNYII